MKFFDRYKDGEEVNDDKRIMKLNNTLLIKSAQKSDTGTYRCVIGDHQSLGQNIIVYSESSFWQEIV